MAQDSARHAAVALALVHESAGPPGPGGEPSGASDSIVSDSVVADTDAASGEASGQQDDGFGFLSLQHTAISVLESGAAAPQPEPELCHARVPQPVQCTNTDEDMRIVAVPVHHHAGDQPCQVGSSAQKQVLVSSAPGSQSSRDQSHPNSHSAPTPPHNDLEPAAGEVSGATVCASGGQDAVVRQAGAAPQPVVFERERPHPVAVDDGASSDRRPPQSASFSSPACLEARPLAPHLQQSLMQSRRAQSCTATPGGDAVTAPTPCLQQTATLNVTRTTSAPLQPPRAIGPAVVAGPGPQRPPAVSAAVANDIDATASAGGAQPEGSCTALESCDDQQDRVPSINEDRGFAHNDTPPSRATAPHRSAACVQHALLVATPTFDEPQNPEFRNPTEPPTLQQPTPEACDPPAAVNSCSNNEAVLQADLRTPQPHENVQLRGAHTLDYNAAAVVQHAPVGEEIPAVTQLLDSCPQAERSEGSMCTSPEGASGNVEDPSSGPPSIARVTTTPAVCSPAQPTSPGIPTASRRQEPANDLPSSPSTPTSLAFQRKLNFSDLTSPPGAPACARQLSRLDSQEAENVPTLRTFQDAIDEPPPLPVRSGRHSGEAGTEEWIRMHSALDGFPVDDDDSHDAQVPPPVLGSRAPVRPLQSLTVDREAPQSRGPAAHGTEDQAPPAAAAPYQRSAQLPMHEAHADVLAQPLLTTSLVDILQQAKALLKTATSAPRSLPGSRGTGLWRHSGIASTAMPASCTANAPQPPATVKQLCDLHVPCTVTRELSLFSQTAPHPPRHQPVASAPLNAHVAGHLMPHTAMHVEGAVAINTPVPNVRVSSKQPHTVASSLKEHNTLPSSVAVKAQSQPHTVATVTPQSPLHTDSRANTRLVPATETKGIHAAPQPLPSKIAPSGPGLLASMKRGQASRAAPAAAPKTSAPETTRMCEKHAAQASQDGALDTSHAQHSTRDVPCDTAPQCDVAAGGAELPSNACMESKPKVSVARAPSCTASVATAPKPCPDLAPWSKLLGKRKLGDMRQSKPLSQHADSDTVTPGGESCRVKQVSVPQRQAGDQNQECATKAHQRQERPFLEQPVIARCDAPQPIGKTGALETDRKPRSVADRSSLSHPEAHPHLIPSNRQQERKGPAQGRIGVPLPAPSIGAQGNKAQRQETNESATAAPKQGTRSGLTKRPVAHKPTLPAFKRLMRGYGCSAQRALVPVGPHSLVAACAQSLSIMDALHMQKSREATMGSASGGLKSNTGETEYVHNVYGTCKRKRPDVGSPDPCASDPAPCLKHHVDVCSAAHHQAPELGTSDGYRHRQFMRAMRWRQEREGMPHDDLAWHQRRVSATSGFNYQSAHCPYKEHSTDLHPHGSCQAVRAHRVSTNTVHVSQRSDCGASDSLPGQSRKVPARPNFSSQHQGRELESRQQGGNRLCSPARGDVLSIESLDSDDLPTLTWQGVTEPRPASHSSDTKRSRSLADSISLAPGTQIVASPCGLGSGAEGQSMQKAAGQSGASLRDVLEASKHKTTVRMEAATMSPVAVQHSPCAAPLSTAEATASLLQLFNNSGKSTALSAPMTEAGFMENSPKAEQRSRRAVKASKLRKVLNLVQQGSGASQQDGSITGSPSSPCTAGQGAGHDYTGRSPTEPDASPEGTQLQVRQAGISGDMYDLPRMYIETCFGSKTVSLHVTQEHAARQRASISLCAV